LLLFMLVRFACIRTVAKIYHAAVLNFFMIPCKDKDKIFLCVCPIKASAHGGK
jgi:hypothetical protein